MQNHKVSEFIKLAYSKGKVQDIEEAFEEYPVENEWHQGKIENVICEGTEQYNIYSIGDIVFVKRYRYQDGKNGNNHLFVIIDQDNLAVPIENFGMLISSQIDKLKYIQNKLLEKDDANGLKVDSIVKTDVIYKITNDNILFKIGKVDIDKIEEYKKSYMELN